MDLDSSFLADNLRLFHFCQRFSPGWGAVNNAISFPGLPKKHSVDRPGTGPNKKDFKQALPVILMQVICGSHLRNTELQPAMLY